MILSTNIPLHVIYTVVITTGNPMFRGYPSFRKIFWCVDMPVLNISFDLRFMKFNVQLIYTSFTDWIRRLFRNLIILVSKTIIDQFTGWCVHL